MKVKITRLKCTKCKKIWTPQQEEVHICPFCKCALTKYPPEVVK